MRSFCIAALLAVASAFTTQPTSFTVKTANVGERASGVFPEQSSAHRTRKATIVMDGKANAIRDRITSVKNTRKITMAMKLVAAAKVRRAQDAVLATRPFSETLQSVFGGLIQRLGGESVDLPLLTEREVKKVTLLVITGDRGLCGGYNSFMIKKAEARFNELKKNGVEADLILVGKKGIAYFERRGFPIRKKYETGQNPTAKQALAIAEEVSSTFLSGESDAVELLYTKFVSLIASSPSIRTLVPFSASDITAKGDEVFQLTSESGQFGVERTELDVAAPQEFPNDMIFEQDPIQIVNAILPLYLNGQILRTLQESVASELAARMQSMQSASDNAGSLAKQLNLEYNRARQAAVTQELLEIVSGASALE
ncbi:precursor of ATPase ATPase gamma subunit [Phaeodactylum tricornutum CCAP 1055/1]|jgi:F-type H+-transporting ATPase subunit gamma|uniref:ATP synthase gamma chain, chloroplastic n=1 Tax=Phaeodactylum tricornutum (strain CCAP 1055/1) TaxID=556484 RepID=B7G0M9_PHATC|nr:precursor of ATPase ATPase gamma subunit [Phaeodactylum tricornutum CCAP 1055/1]EEC47913.1 precursor of ATPase ATPase gamma subunit [Phaeodactylum tricornutum CCAP 1055/1]|eukprot:XP_002180505.1 precursor of ATPase ATPase gamma subunit [Phaeodactylum tricornutum CCAP 1055/1]